MRRWLALSAAALSLAGCTSTPKREMRPPKTEELVTPPPGQYVAPRDDIPRDAPLISPKAAPNLNTNGPNRPGVTPGPMMGAPGGAGR
jgi:hypothetical protein